MLEERIDEVLANHEFGEPWKWGEKAAGLLVPIIRVAKVPERKYVMVEEVKEKIGIEDTGNISIARVINESGKTIFIRGGTVLSGKGTQSRAVQMGTVMQPGKQEVPINCVHASHGIQQGASFELFGLAPRNVEQALRGQDQGEVWASVSAFCSDIAAAGAGAACFGGDNLVGTMKSVETVETVNNFKADVNDAIRRMPRLLNQVGVVVFDMQGIVGLEVFDHPASWEALCENVVKQYSDVMAQEKPDYLSIDTDRVIVTIRAFLEQAKECVEEPKVNGTVVLTGEISGEYTEFEGGLIHLLLARTLKDHSSQGEFVNSDFRVVGQTGAFTADFFSLAGSSTVLDKLEGTTLKWKEMAPLFNSSHTQARVLNEAKKEGFIAKGPKGGYCLTAKGSDALNRHRRRKEL